MIRDDEIERLTKYAEGMGVSVLFSRKYSEDSAEWHTDGKKIVIYQKSHDSKLDIVLSLIHEIAHQKGYIENGRVLDPKIVEALTDEEERKSARKRIYLEEAKDTKYWEQIYRDTDCKFDISKLHKQKEFDIWQYEMYYETGKFPTRKENREKLKELRKKYKKNCNR